MMVSWDMLVFWDDTILCNNFARWLQKMASCDVLVFLDATIFCNNFTRWLQKIASCDAFVSGMLLSFVTTLQDDNKRWYHEICWFSGQGNMQLRNVRFTIRKSPVIQIVSISKVSKSVVACHPVSGMILSFVTTFQDDYKR